MILGSLYLKFVVVNTTGAAEARRDTLRMGETVAAPQANASYFHGRQGQLA